MTTKTTKTTAPATKPATTPAVKATKPATKPAVKATTPAVKATKPAVKATKPAVKATAPAVKATKPAVKATAPAVKATTPAVKATAPAVKAETTEKARKARISKVGSAWTALSGNILELVAKDSKSSVGQFIIKLFKETKSNITGELLAKAFVASFKTKTGIEPDEKWARRNVKLFVDNGLMKVKAHQL